MEQPPPDAWGYSEAPLLDEPLPPLPPEIEVLSSAVEPTLLPAEFRAGSSTASDLPEAVELQRRGWRLLGPAPSLQCLPAIWPRDHRGWVPDRTPQVDVRRDLQGRLVADPRPESLRQQLWEDYVSLITEECGLPAPPRGRLWFIRSPWSSFGVDLIVELLARRAAETGSALGRDPRSSSTLIQGVDVLGWTEAEVWSWFADDPRATVLREWLSRGYSGEHAAPLTVVGLSVKDLDLLSAGLDEGGAGLTPEQAVAWKANVPSTEEVVEWRRLGVSADPMPYASVIQRSSSRKAAAFVENGFLFDDFVLLHNVPLERALEWRHAGFGATEVIAMLEADHRVSPAEAQEFVDRGIGDETVSWLAYGFTALQAKAFRDLDINVQEARTWRSIGAGPSNAREQRSRGGGRLPEGRDFGWIGPASASDRERFYDVRDPAETRGSRARTRL